MWLLQVSSSFSQAGIRKSSNLSLHRFGVCVDSIWLLVQQQMDSFHISEKENEQRQQQQQRRIVAHHNELLSAYQHPICTIISSFSSSVRSSLRIIITLSNYNRGFMYNNIKWNERACLRSHTHIFIYINTNRTEEMMKIVAQSTFDLFGVYMT